MHTRDTDVDVAFRTDEQCVRPSEGLFDIAVAVAILAASAFAGIIELDALVRR